MDDQDWKLLESSGWPRDIVEILKKSPTIGPVDYMLCDRTLKALAIAGYEPLEYLAANPFLSKTQLVETLGHGASGFGLAMAVYEEAASKGIVRDVAKNLLIRKLHEEFSAGWTSKHNSTRNLGFWDSEVAKYGHDPRIEHYVEKIIRHLTVDHPPPEGWKPQWENDPLIDELFDCYWPVERLC